MSVFISMLRGINVGGQKNIRMEALCELYEGLGFAHVRTYVQSGNVIFESAGQSPVDLATQIERRIEQSFGYPVAVFIRDPVELKQILAGNPFLKDRNEDPSKLHVSFLYQAPAKTAWVSLQSPAGITDDFALAERAVYLFCPNGYGKTKLSNSFFERKLGVQVTTRNWNTVNALYNMAVET